MGIAIDAADTWYSRLGGSLPFVLYLCWQMLGAGALPAYGPGLGAACNGPSIASARLHRRRLVSARSASFVYASRYAAVLCSNGDGLGSHVETAYT